MKTILCHVSSLTYMLSQVSDHLTIAQRFSQPPGTNRSPVFAERLCAHIRTCLQHSDGQLRFQPYTLLPPCAEPKRLTDLRAQSLLKFFLSMHTALGICIVLCICLVFQIPEICQNISKSLWIHHAATFNFKFLICVFASLLIYHLR